MIPKLIDRSVVLETVEIISELGLVLCKTPGGVDRNLYLPESYKMVQSHSVGTTVAALQNSGENAIAHDI